MIRARPGTGWAGPVSYTHLDVYKRQRYGWDITEQTQPGIFAGGAVPGGFEAVYENSDLTVFKVIE